MSVPTVPTLTSALDAAIAEGAFPAAQAAVVVEGTLVHASAHGRVQGVAVDHDTLFDVASVTKLVATTAAIAILRSRLELAFDDPVADFLPLFARNGKSGVTIRQLLAHGSGLPAWKPLFLHARRDPVARAIYPGLDDDARVGRALAFERAREIVVDAALTAPQAGPVGERVYSDLGFIALGEVVAAVTGEDLDTFCSREVFAPLGAARTRFFDLRAPAFEPRPIAPTGRTRPREPAPGQESLYTVQAQEPELRPGEVDDDNAYAMSGIAGHAGLFSTARDLARLGWGFLADIQGAENLVARDVFAEMASPDPTTRGAPRGLGFDRPAPEGSSAGRHLGRAGPLGAVGHLGFTGCSLWLDLDRRCVVALVTNRTLPGRHNVAGIRAFRPRFHDRVTAVVDGDLDADAPTEPGAS